MDDARNVTDEYKGKPLEEIITDLETKATGLEVAIENLERDFNMGTIVRTANAFGARRIHVIGRRQWNKRGAMMTDKYLEVIYHASIEEFYTSIGSRPLVIFDNVTGSVPLQSAKLPSDGVLVFGAEGPGISDELLKHASQIVAIEQFGSTRSINVGVAAGIAMYAWLRQNHLT